MKNPKTTIRKVTMKQPSVAFVVSWAIMNLRSKPLSRSKADIEANRQCKKVAEETLLDIAKQCDKINSMNLEKI